MDKEFEEAVNLTEKEIAFIKRHKELHKEIMEEYERIKRNRSKENQTGDKK